MPSTSASMVKLLSETTMDLLELIGTPRSLALAISYRTSSYRSVDPILLGDPSTYSVDRYRRDSQAVALFKKSTYLDESDDLDANAVKGFLSIEAELKIYNQTKNSFDANGIFYTASRIIRKILGKVPEYEDLKVSFTSGATFSRTVDNATIADKISGQLDVTTHALPHLLKWLGAHPTLFYAYSDKKIITVPGNKFSTVPKDFRKKRTICKEPLGNMLLQRSFGLYIRDRLKRENIYIETGQSDHTAVLLHDADAWATIDQSDASDRISWKLVKELLPTEWFSIFDQIRSKRTLVNGQWHELEKFMTQGNGFTFELETLVFYAIAQAIAINKDGKRQPIFVYGDDMIVPVRLACEVVESFKHFGLKVNREKSFLSGPFKESCGFDILCGSAVRPYYLKELETNDLLFKVQLCNYVKRVLNHVFYDYYDVFRSRPWLRAYNSIPTVERYHGPSSFGDSVIITDYRVPGKDTYWKSGVLYITTYNRKYYRRDYHQPIGWQSELAYALLGFRSSGTLVRSAKYKVKPARACPVYWA